jgi:hypothetical protein
MVDAQATAGQEWLRSARTPPALRKEVADLVDAVQRLSMPTPAASPEQVPALVDDLLGGTGPRLLRE